MKQIFAGLVIFCFLSSCHGQKYGPNCKYSGGSADFLEGIGCPSDFNYLKGRPLSEKLGKAESVKIVYDIKANKVFFLNSTRYPFHYQFCTAVLDVPDELWQFNIRNYRENNKREFILCNLNYYSSNDVYALELMPEDDSPAEKIHRLFTKISGLVYFPTKMKMLMTSPEMQHKYAVIKSLPLITSDDIYKGRQFVSLNKGEAYGYLRKATVADLDRKNFDKHDIILLNGLPNQLPVVAGVLTVPFQTPLCHISLLCLNRGTPNATYRAAWNDKGIAALENKLVYYKVEADTFTLTIAREKDAQLFWARKERRKPIQLKIDSSRRGLVELSTASFKNVSLVGGKAANFAELLKIKVDNKNLPVPEGSFSIPFGYYCQHLRKHGIDKMIDSILSNKQILDDPVKLELSLNRVQFAIKLGSLDSDLKNAVISRLKKNGSTFINYRFRSSTNAEDVKGFNGAGLYESKTGSLTEADKPVEKAIKAVWASLWDPRAFIERQYFMIDQHSVAMGILVHRAFGDELSNGVAVTRHMYRPRYPAYTMNVQVGEISVVTPPDSVTCDEAIIGLGEVTGTKNISIEYIGRSSLSKEKPVLTNEQVELLAKYLTAIKQHFYYKVETGSRPFYFDYGMDVEFKIDAMTGKLYIKQARTL